MKLSKGLRSNVRFPIKKSTHFNPSPETRELSFLASLSQVSTSLPSSPGRPTSVTRHPPSPNPAGAPLDSGRPAPHTRLSSYQGKSLSCVTGESLIRSGFPFSLSIVSSGCAVGQCVCVLTFTSGQQKPGMADRMNEIHHISLQWRLYHPRWATHPRWDAHPQRPSRPRRPSHEQTQSPVHVNDQRPLPW